VSALLARRLVTDPGYGSAWWLNLQVRL